MTDKLKKKPLTRWQVLWIDFNFFTMIFTMPGIFMLNMVVRFAFTVPAIVLFAAALTFIYTPVFIIGDIPVEAFPLVEKTALIVGIGLLLQAFNSFMNVWRDGDYDVWYLNQGISDALEYRERARNGEFDEDDDEYDETKIPPKFIAFFIAFAMIWFSQVFFMIWQAISLSVYTLILNLIVFLLLPFLLLAVLAIYSKFRPLPETFQTTNRLEDDANTDDLDELWQLWDEDIAKLVQE